MNGEQSKLFDRERGEVLRDDAIARVDEHAALSWKDRALAAVWQCAVRHELFTTDDVWAAIPGDATTHEPRAIGAIMRNAAARRWIVTTSLTRMSERPECHRRPVRVWRSRVPASARGR